MQTSPILLGQIDGGGNLSEPNRCLVYQRWCEHRAGCDHTRSADASLAPTERTAGTEASSRHHIWPWRVVSLYARTSSDPYVDRSCRVCLVSIIRLHSLVRISNSKDPTFDNPPAATFSAVEVNVGIICACLPSIRPALSAILPHHFAPTSRPTISRMPDKERANGRQTVYTHTRPRTASTRPYTAQSSNWSHSRTGSSSTVSRAGSELKEVHRQQAMLGTGSKVNGPVRQVTINPATQLPPYSLTPPRLPMLPENMALVSPIEPTEQHLRFSLNLGRTPNGRTRRHQKPLPLTPLPITDQPWFWSQPNIGEHSSIRISQQSPRT